MTMDDVNRIFKKYLDDHAGQRVIDFQPLLSKHPNLKESFEKKIKIYEEVLGVMGGPVIEDKPPSLLGREIGKCNIFRVLGQGEMGVSCLGWHEKLGCDVVVKVLRPFAVENKVLKERFLQEGRILVRLNHKNVVPVYDVGEDGDSLFIITKHLEGIPLSLLIQKLSGIDRSILKMTNIASALNGEALDRFKTPTEFFCTLMLQITEAVQYAQDNGVIHRNIKPSNIIIDTKGTPVLLDFGLSHDEIEKNLTPPGESQGTPIYSAPELFGKGPVKDNRLLDVYSLGVTLYEAVTGGLPYEGDGISEILSNIKSKEPIRPKVRWDGIPPDLEKIIDTAIAKDADFRYQAAGTFREDLEHFLNYHPVRAKPPSVIQRLVYFARRSRWMLTAGLLVGSLLLGTYYFYRPVADYFGKKAAAKKAELNQEQVKALLPEVLNSLSSNDYAATLEAVDKIYRLYPDNTSVAVWHFGLKAKIDHDIQKFKEAISALEKNHPGDLYVRLAKIIIYHEENNSEKADQEKQIIFKNLNDETMWRHLPAYLYSLGVSPSLIHEFLEFALKKYPQDADLNFMMSSFCENYLKDDTCHKEYSRRAARSSSRYVAALADIYSKSPTTSQELKDVISELEEMQKKSSTALVPDFFKNMATLYDRAGDCTASLDAINKAISLDPGRSYYLDKKENLETRCKK